MNTKQIFRIVQLTLATAAAFTLAGTAEARNHPSNRIILVRPTELPELARVAGQAMLLRETGDGRTLLYIEQDNGAQLAIFDVTNPAKIKQETAARLETPGSFDFVSSLGGDAELVRFRQGQGEAVLDLREVKFPTIKMVQGLKFQGLTERLGDDGFLVADRPNSQSGPNDPNYQLVDTSNPLHPNTIADVNQVLEKVTNDETGTTFLLGADGLYLIRRPAVEKEYKLHEYQMEYPG